MPKLQALTLARLVALALPLAVGAVGAATTQDAIAAPPPAAKAKDTPAKEPAKTKEPVAKEPLIDPKAMDLLKRSSEKMTSLTTFSVHADATKDEVVRDGFKVQKAMTEDVLVQKPNHMRAEVAGDNGKRTLVYDGKSLSILAASENYYATVPAAATIGDTLEAVTSKYDLELPLTDLLYMAHGGDIGKNVTEAGVIGTSRVAGAECDHLAFRTKAVDWQLWVERGALLPRKVVVTTRGVDTEPQYEATMTWNTSPNIGGGDFTFKPPQGALPMQVRLLNGAAPQAKPESKPSK